ncbi:hypothetical protein GOEFS_060_00350 [Gordonia effusa NBRC 100432]|uniref:PPE family domain-containing protein n=1 Tax=Gordonia effusa NBRC 100432 TaxID=1077974 RepID=H0R0P1_9ACTN|nr:hypothetical protein [Gordonia effusa]GAB18642.1 hypothetical protein GOEFS_060_00350 [Gordonia effusa NBRC 100432]
MVAGGARTDWDAHSVADIIAKLQTMDSAQARADAAALATAVSSAQAVAQRIASVFENTEWILKGKAANGGYNAAQRIAVDIAKDASVASRAISALSEAGETLRAAAHTQFTLVALQAQMAAEPENAAVIKAAVTETMNVNYSDPMSGTPVPGALAGNTVKPTARSGPNGEDTAAPSARQSPDDKTPATISPTNAPSNTKSPGSQTPASTKNAKTPTTTIGTQQNSAPKSTDAPTANDKGQRDKQTPTPIRTDPNWSKKDKPLNLNRGAAPLSIRSPGTRGAVPAPAIPLRRVGISPIAPASTMTPGTPSPANRGSMQQPYAPHAGRSRGGEDGKHKAASFLNTARNGEEVVGSLPLVGPPVIGDWAGSPDQARPVEADRKAEK